MAQIAIHPHADGACIEAAKTSLLSVADALESSAALRERIADAFPDLFEGIDRDDGKLVMEGLDGFLVHAIHSSANRTGKIVLCVRASERHRELVAAVASDRDLEIFESHGWPILSLRSDNAMMAEGEVANKRLPGGAA